jgi:hypothetical protein
MISIHSIFVGRPERIKDELGTWESSKGAKAFFRAPRISRLAGWVMYFSKLADSASFAGSRMTGGLRADPSIIHSFVGALVS